MDYLRTLSLEAGISRATYLSAPDGDRSMLWVLATDIGQAELRQLHQEQSGFDLSLVGAADVRRSRVYARAAGEAVERFALLPPLKTDSKPARIIANGGANWGKHLAGQTVPALAGRHVSQSGSSLEAFVPQTAVDYPPKTQYDSKTFDPSPSGTASGTSRDDALERACKEVLERDAAMTAWIKRSCLDRVDIDGVEARVGDFKKLASRARILGLDFVLAYLAPTSNIAQPIMCMLFDEKNGVACAGLGLERDEANGAFRAFQEALQVRTVLLTRAEAARGQSVRYPVTDDEDRAAYWGSSQGIDAAHEWLRLVSRVPRALSGPRESVPWSTLVGERLEVDLTHRLPPRIKDMGWAVVKVMSPLLQPLRMSDAVSWNISNEEDRLTYNLLSSPHPYI